MMVTSGRDGIKVWIYTCNRSVNWCNGAFLTTYNCCVWSCASLIWILYSIQLSMKSIWKVRNLLRQHIALYFVEKCREQVCTTVSFKILVFSSLIVVFLCHSALSYSEVSLCNLRVNTLRIPRLCRWSDRGCGHCKYCGRQAISTIIFSTRHDRESNPHIAIHNLFSLLFQQAQFTVEDCETTVTYRPIARQRVDKRITAEAYARNNRTFIARQRISKQAFSIIQRLFSARSVSRGYKGFVPLAFE
jgi:hypothetical protein